jgi:hypothetical protein
MVARSSFVWACACTAAAGAASLSLRTHETDISDLGIGMIRGVGPPDWFDACESTNTTVLEHCCNATHRSGCDLRIMRKPNGTVAGDTHAARFPVDKPWEILYEYAVPLHKPSGPDWDAGDEVTVGLPATCGFVNMQFTHAGVFHLGRHRL